MKRTALLLLLLACPARAGRAAGPEWETAFSQMKDHLKALIRLDTSNPPGNEILAAQYLKKVLEAEGIEGRVYVSTGTRASLIARLKGNGRKRPLLLMCHTDVVPAEKEQWSVDPFSAEEKDGYVWGRGAADMKGQCAAELMTLLLLKRRRAALERDVIFFAEADEEVGGGDRHILWLLKRHGAELDAEFGINEGGSSVWREGRVDAVNVQTAEKRYLDVRLLARGTPGHASVPRSDNPVYAIGRALARLSAYEPPAEIDPIVYGYLKATIRPEDQKRYSLLRKLDGLDGVEAASELSRLDPELGAMLRDTVSATMLKGGYKNNVIPSEAEATLNCRLLPGRDPKAFIRELAKVIQEPGVELQFEASDLGPVPAMPVDTPLFSAISEAVFEQHPQARVLPFMSAWSTDSQDLRARGVVLYGFDPPLTAADSGRAHGNDERIEPDALNAYLRLLYRVVEKTAGAPHAP